MSATPDEPGGLVVTATGHKVTVFASTRPQGGLGALPRDQGHLLRLRGSKATF